MNLMALLTIGEICGPNTCEVLRWLDPHILGGTLQVYLNKLPTLAIVAAN
jgi:hypothetical protein